MKILHNWLEGISSGLPEMTVRSNQFYTAALQQNKPLIMPDLMLMLVVPKIAKELSEIGARSVQSLNIKDLDITKCNPKYLAAVGALEADVVVGVNKGVYDNTTQFYTRSVRILQALERKGLLDKDTDIEKAIKSLSGDKAKKGIADNTIAVVRLDVVGIAPKLQIKAVAMLKRLSIEDTLLYPISVVKGCVAAFEEYVINNKYIRIMREVETGVKQAVLTVNRADLRDVYESVNIDNLDERLKSKLVGVQIGFDLLTQKYYAYNAESSIYSRGQIAVKLNHIKEAKAITLAEIDKTVSNKDLTNINRIFEKKVNAMPKEDLKKLAIEYLVLDADKKYTVSEIREMLKVWSAEQDAASLYKLMNRDYAGEAETENENKEVKESAQGVKVFGNVDKSIDNFARTQPKESKSLSEMDRPYTIEGIKEALKTRILRITYRTKSGEIARIEGTNNEDILRRAYRSKTFIRKLESSNRRLKEARTYIVDALQRDATDLDIGNILEKYDVVGALIEGTTLFDINNVKETAIDAIDDVLKKSREAMSNKDLGPNMILVRSIRAETPKEYYRYVNFDTIVAVQQSAEYKGKSKM